MNDDKRIVPITPLLLRYQRLASGREEDRWEEARLFEEHPEGYMATFADDFGESVAKFSKYDNADEPFYDKLRTERADRVASDDHSNTYDLVKELMRPGFVCVPFKDENRVPVTSDLLEDVPAEDLAFRCIDREPLIHRTTRSTWEDGRPALGGIRIDLLMGSGAAELPAVGELKIGDDRDPFFALFQSLAGLAHLATEPQYRRVVKTYGEDERLSAPAEPPQLDAYVLHFRPVPPDNDERARCKRAAERFRNDILMYEAVSRSVRRVAVLELFFDADGEVTAAVRFGAQRRT